MEAIKHSMHDKDPDLDLLFNFCFNIMKKR